MSMDKAKHILPSDDLKFIIKGCLDNDRASQAKLYNLYAANMMSVCSWYARNREEAEEVLHDGFMRVFTYLAKFTGDGSFEGWIRKIMVNAALSKYRNKKTSLYLVTEYNPSLHDSNVQPGFINNYDEKELMKMVQLLPPGYRIVFNLHVFEGFTHIEISEALGISAGTSKSNLSDARKFLQGNLSTGKIKEVI